MSLSFANPMEGNSKHLKKVTYTFLDSKPHACAVGLAGVVHGKGC